MSHRLPSSPILRLLRGAGIIGVLAVIAPACTPAAPQQKRVVAAEAPRAGSTTGVDRSVIPKGGPQPELRAPRMERVVLDNGLTVLVVQKRELPLVDIRVVVRAGSAADPRKNLGLAGFTGDLLKYGSVRRSAAQVADEVETLGSHISVSVAEESTIVGATVMTSSFPLVFEIVAELLLQPAFAAAELERVRKQRLGYVAQAQKDPGGMASRAFLKTVYGDHPYGHTALGTGKGIRAVKRPLLVDFYRRYFRANNAAVILVGDVDIAEAVATVKKRLGSWSGGGEQTRVVEPPQTSGGVVLVHKAGAPQSQLRVGHVGVRRAHPDYFAIVMCNAILGGLFNSRINMNLREDKAYTYGAHSGFSFRRGRGPFAVRTGVHAEVTDKAIIEILKETEKLRQDGVTAEELQHAKNSYSLSLPGYFQSIGTIGSMAANIFLYDLPLTYYQDLPQALARVTVADVQRVARAHLLPQRMAIVVVGDESVVGAGLRALKRGKVERRDGDGRVLPVR